MRAIDTIKHLNIFRIINFQEPCCEDLSVSWQGERRSNRHSYSLRIDNVQGPSTSLPYTHASYLHSGEDSVHLLFGIK